MAGKKVRRREPMYKEGGIRYKLIYILHNTGIIPYQYLELLPYSKQAVQKKIIDMKKVGELEEHTTKKHDMWYRVLYIAHYKETIKLYLSYLPKGYSEFYRENLAILTSDVKRRNRNVCERIYCNAGIVMMMDGAQITYAREKKPLLAKKEDLPQDQIIYYTDTEIKKYSHYRATTSENLINHQRELTYSRINGMIFAPDEDYAVFNIGKEVGRWNKRGEKKIKVKLNQIITSKKYGRREVRSAILFANSYTLLQKGYKPLADIDQFNAITYSYSCVLFFPMDKKGQKNLEIVLSADHWSIICEMIYGYTPERDSRQNWYDFYIGETYDLVFCVPDIKKLERFVNHAEDIADRRKMRIICFDYQKEYLKLTSQGLCRISICSLDEAYREFRTKEG